MHQRSANPDEAGWWADGAQPLAHELRSARLDRHLSTARARTNGAAHLTPPPSKRSPTHAPSSTPATEQESAVAKAQAPRR
jgi:hypothetical protein